MEPDQHMEYFYIVILSSFIKKSDFFMPITNKFAIKEKISARKNALV
ncbi:hypothetical protein KP78_01800 [Jeotgalibacillus soli]|uniref:Uncharacterized protein n=1 Tax=Jeotgalibacillus soli TaxID=889306 RepID=A0A0C2RNG2_9BACL|nr:hypothetical protein KP78_01800 [Jeotgalibacillus soli]